MNFTARLTEFKDDIKEQKLNSEEIFQKYVVEGSSYLFTDILKNANEEYKIKTIVSEFLNVHPREVVFVGSGKLGFSLKPRNLFNEFDHKFKATKKLKDKSDLDIAVVSEFLFNDIGRGVYEYTNYFSDKWLTSEYYPKGHPQTKSAPLYYQYCEYFSKGWFRPDMKPLGYDFCKKGTFEDLKRVLLERLDRNAGIGIYKDWYYFKNYHLKNISLLTYKVKGTVI